MIIEPLAEADVGPMTHMESVLAKQSRWFADFLPGVGESNRKLSGAG